MGIHEGYQVVPMAFVFDPILHFLSFFVCVCVCVKSPKALVRLCGSAGSSKSLVLSNWSSIKTLGVK